jgi:hypothetical protein
MSNEATGVLIANPIYDSAFKYLMATDRENARYFVGTVLGEEITEIEYLSQEYSYLTKQNKETENESESEKVERLRLMRLDFVATIRTKSGENKRLLIEIQKASNPLDLLRFREYLGLQYQQHDQIQINDNIVEQAMPIVVIYMLGFNLSGINTIAMKVNRTYIDLINPDAKLDKNPYVECLSHDCYYIQISRINAETYTEWEKCSELLQMLSLFEQDYFVEEKYIKRYPYIITNKNIKKMLHTLEYATADPLTRKIMREEYWASMNEKIWKNQVATLSEKNATLSSEIVTLSSEIAELQRQLQQAGITIPTNLN